MAATADAFRHTTPFERRKQVSDSLRSRYPGMVPIILVKSKYANASTTPDAAKFKYLVPQDAPVGRFLAEVRKNLGALRPEEAIYLFVGSKNVLPPCAALVAQIDSRYRDDDGFLYVTYSGENTFGGLN